MGLMRLVLPLVLTSVPPNTPVTRIPELRNTGRTDRDGRAGTRDDLGRRAYSSKVLTIA